MWIIALSQPLSYLPWAGPIWGAMLVYTLVMARRAETAPIEIPALLRSLGLSSTSVAKAKRAQSGLRLLVIGILAGVPLVLRAPQMGSAAVFVLVSAALALGATVWSNSSAS